MQARESIFPTFFLSGFECSSFLWGEDKKRRDLNAELQHYDHADEDYRLLPPLGIAGAGIALCGAYVVMLAVMHVLTRRVFAVDFEWRRLAQLCLVMGGVAALGDLLLPTAGVVGFVTRAAALLAVPLILLATGFFHAQERRQVRALLARVRRLNATPAEGA